MKNKFRFLLKQMKAVYFSFHRDATMDLYVISPVVLIGPGELFDCVILGFGAQFNNVYKAARTHCNDQLLR